MSDKPNNIHWYNVGILAFIVGWTGLAGLVGYRLGSTGPEEALIGATVWGLGLTVVAWYLSARFEGSVNPEASGE